MFDLDFHDRIAYFWTDELGAEGGQKEHAVSDEFQEDEGQENGASDADRRLPEPSLATPFLGMTARQSAE